MNSRFERCLVEQCAPTLAGIKAGSLFCYTAEANEELGAVISCWNSRLREKGVRICLVRADGAGGGLIYVFRPAALKKLLADQEITRFLHSRGFAGCHHLDTYIGRLRQRLRREARFPHEIGIFLGYPLHDVEGFIQNGGKNFCLCGLWKVYQQQHCAERQFARYKQCRSIYKTRFEQGSDVLQLTVTA